jgi:uncharacterized protein (TIGR03437 family)
MNAAWFRSMACTAWVAVAFCAHGQVTVIAVVNAASYATPVQPGSVISIFGTNLAAASASATGFPLPMTLAGTSVSINGVTAPLVFVSSSQVNAQMPSSGLSTRVYGSASVTVTTAGGTSAPFQVQTAQAAPGLFTADISGCGQAAVLNVAPDGSVSVNSPANSAAPGDYLSIFATGFGPPLRAVPDGAAAPSSDQIIWGLGATLGLGSAAVNGSGSRPYVTYSGRAPGMAGVDQMNLLIPQDVTQGCSVPLQIDSDGIVSPTVSVSIHSGRGSCVDPPPSSYGRIVLTRTIASGTANDGETDTLTAGFPSGPNIQAPGPPRVGNFLNSSVPVPTSRSCAVPGFTELSAGDLTLQASGKAPVTIAPEVQPGGVSYQQNLPAGFLQPGQYTVSSGAGAAVSFSTTFSLGTPVQVQTDLSPGTVISASKGFQIQWTGGDAADLVRVELVSSNPTYAANPFDVFWGTVGADSVKMGGLCSQSIHMPPSCSWGLPGTNSGEVIVDVLPANDVAATVSATGLTEGVQLSWVYRYVFGGLSVN